MQYNEHYMTDTQEKVERFFQKGSKREFASGELILFPGMDGVVPINYLKQGRVIQYDINEEGDRSIVNIFKPHAFFPLQVAVNDATIGYFFEADTATEVYQVDPTKVRDFLLQEPDVMYDVLSRICRGLDGLLGRTTQLLNGNAKNRVLYELSILSQRFGKATGDGIEVSITAGRLAEMTGLTRETVSRSLQTLRQAGLVRLRRGTVTVLGPKFLS